MGISQAESRRDALRHQRRLFALISGRFADHGGCRRRSLLKVLSYTLRSEFRTRFCNEEVPLLSIHYHNDSFRKV